MSMNLEQSDLGKKSDYKTEYDKSLLFPIARKIKRDELGIADAEKLFSGCDIWNAYEVSWLNLKGKPLVKILKIVVDSNSECIIESKSLKLYLNSFNNTQFESTEVVKSIIERDLSQAANGNVEIIMVSLNKYSDTIANEFDAISIDDIDCTIGSYETDSSLLAFESESDNTIVSESLCSDLLKSNCLVTGQPDWGSVLIKYEGNKISREALLKYLISFRNHNEFHEQCVEKIYSDIMAACNPSKLTVYARYTRRGGIDINPLRSNFESGERYKNIRLNRQ